VKTGTTRKSISAAKLHDMLSAEFRKTAGDMCLKCAIPMPAYREPGQGAGPNWRIGGTAECSSLCHTILEDLVAELAARYDITRPRT
jgi:hypothetical protein